MINTAAYPKIKTKQKGWEIRIGAFLAKKKKSVFGEQDGVELQFLLLNMNVFFIKHT